MCVAGCYTTAKSEILRAVRLCHFMHRCCRRHRRCCCLGCFVAFSDLFCDLPRSMRVPTQMIHMTVCLCSAQLCALWYFKRGVCQFVESRRVCWCHGGFTGVTAGLLVSRRVCWCHGRFCTTMAGFAWSNQFVRATVVPLERRSCRSREISPDEFCSCFYSN